MGRSCAGTRGAATFPERSIVSAVAVAAAIVVVVAFASAFAAAAAVATVVR